jgi:hypothetical protein
VRLFWRVHRAFMRLTGGRFGRVAPMDALLLTTRRTRRTPNINSERNAGFR